MFSKSLIIFTAFSLDTIQLALDHLLPQTRCWAISNTEWSGWVILCLFFTCHKTRACLRGRDGEILFPAWCLRSQVYDPLHPAHTDQAWEKLSWGSSPMELQGSSSRVGAEAGRGGKEKLPAQQSTGSPAPRGQESRTCCRLLCAGGLGTSCDFFNTLFN